MLFRTKTLMYDALDKSKVFPEGTFLRVNAKERAEALIARGLVDTVEETEGMTIVELDPKTKSTPAPKKPAAKKPAAKKTTAQKGK